MNERVFNKQIAKLRTPERVAGLEVSVVVDECLSGGEIVSVLDVGAGSGVFAEEFRNRNVEITAIDSNEEMIAAFREFVPGVEIRQAVAENMPFPDSAFDLVFMGVVLHEVDDYTKAMQEAFRVSAKRVMILEWKYKIEDFGPPLEHRLQSSFIEKLALDTGFEKTEIITLKNLVLYKLTK